MRPKLEVADIFRRHGDASAPRKATGSPSTSARSWPRSRPAAPRRSAVTSSAARIAARPASPTIPVATGTVRSVRVWRALQWLADRRAELLPVPYFHVVFTVPAPIAAIALQNKALVYDILFKAAAETIRVIGADPKHLGAETGMIAILHTWGQTLTHHPHAHCIVPGGGLGPDGRWIACKPNFFLPVHVLSRCFRRLFLERLQAAFDAGGIAFFGDLAGLQRSVRLRRISRTALENRPGSSLPNALLPAPRRSSNISAATRIASPSPTAVFSIAAMVASAFGGRIIAPKTSPRR